MSPIQPATTTSTSSSAVQPAQPAQPATTTSSSSSINMETTPASLRQSAGLLADLQTRCMPKPTLVTLRQPLHLAAWRVETSPRVCLFTGTDQDISTDAPPHTLPKILLEDRSKRPAPSRIHLLVPDDDIISPVAIRTSLLHHAQTALVPYTHQRLPLAQINQPVLDHTLEEAVACLIHAPPLHHTHIELNEQPAPWDKDHIDSR